MCDGGVVVEWKVVLMGVDSKVQTNDASKIYISSCAFLSLNFYCCGVIFNFIFIDRLQCKLQITEVNIF